MESAERRKKMLLVVIVLLAATTGCGPNHAVERMAQELYSKSTFVGPLPPHAFASDGCSCWPDSDWVECCIEHDLVYWMGGTREQRKQADLKLKKCVSEKGHPVTGQFMYFGVRLGGVWWLPTPFRWGFGWEYPQSGPPDTPY